MCTVYTVVKVRGAHRSSAPPPLYHLIFSSATSYSVLQVSRSAAPPLPVASILSSGTYFQKNITTPRLQLTGIGVRRGGACAPPMVQGKKKLLVKNTD